jgi:hypothetical protein
MKFFFPDSLDTVAPRYDFEAEEHSPHRVRHRTDVFAHEYLRTVPYDGILVSKALVDGYKGQRRYRDAQRLRLHREGSHRFFRAEQAGLETMGDCGAYAYLSEPAPPFELEEVLDFYAHGRFDYTFSVDHVIPGYRSPNRLSDRTIPNAWRERYDLNLDLAERYLALHRQYHLLATPIGTVQGWNPASYIRAAGCLEKMGYTYLALGGLASLQTEDIMACVEAVQAAVRPSTRLHLLGVSRPDTMAQLHRWGIASFDSTMPLRQAFMDDKHNYHTADGAYLALRLPPSVGNARIARLVRSGEVSTHDLLSAEQQALDVVTRFEDGDSTVEDVVDAVSDYEQLYNGRDHRDQYRRLLHDRPWKACACRACEELGIQVVVFRGRERNKRRGYHNLQVFARQLRTSLSSTEEFLSTIHSESS